MTLNRFDEFYHGDTPSFGTSATSEIVEYVRGNRPAGRALDLGAGDGRNTIYLARTGFKVTAVDTSGVGLQKLMRNARTTGLEDRIIAILGDARHLDYPLISYDLVIAVTLFDHLPRRDIEPLFTRVSASIKPGGAMFVKVHTVDDPGCSRNGLSASELSPMIRHYFHPGELRTLVNGDFEVMSYDERVEEDTSHGNPHHHGFATMLVRKCNGR